MHQNIRRTIILGILLSGIFQSGKAGEDADTPDGWVTIVTVIGNAEVKVDENAIWRPMHAGMRMEMTCQIRTLEESSVKLLFESGTEIELSEMTRVHLTNLYADVKEFERETKSLL